MKRIFIVFIVILICTTAYAKMDTHLIEGNTLYHKGDYHGAIKAYQQVVKKDDYPDAVIGIINANQRLGKLDQITKEYQRQNEDNPDSFGHFGLGYCYLSSGLKDKAAQEFRLCGSWYGYLGIGWLAEDNGSNKEAMNWYKKAAKIATREELSTVLYHQARLYQKLNKTSQSIKLFVQVIASEPFNTEAYFSLAEILRKKGVIDDSICLYQKIINIEPTYLNAYDPIILFQLKSLRDTEELKILRKYYKKDVKKNPNDPVAHYILGTFYYFTRNYVESFDEFEKAQKLDPLFKEISLNLLWIYKELDCIDRASSIYQKIINSTPGETRAMVYMSQLYANNEAYRKALKYAHTATKIEPRLDKGHFALGNAYYYMGQYVDAIRQYKMGTALTKGEKLTHLYIQEAFQNKYFPLFVSAYLVIYLIIAILLISINFLALFLVKNYKMLSRYIIKKRYFLVLYTISIGALFFSCMFGKELFKFIPIVFLEEIFFSLCFWVPAGIIILMIICSLLSIFLRNPVVKIYAVLILLDFSLDLAIIIFLVSLLPIFADYPDLLPVLSFILLIFRRIGIFVLICIFAAFILYLENILGQGYILLNEGKEECLSYFDKMEKTINKFWLRWLEPTYSDLSARIAVGKSFLYLDKKDYKSAEACWEEVGTRLIDWWPLSHKGKFFYDYFKALIAISSEKIEEGIAILEEMLNLREYHKRQRFIYILLQKAYQQQNNDQKAEEYVRLVSSIRLPKRYRTQDWRYFIQRSDAMLTT